MDWTRFSNPLSEREMEYVPSVVRPEVDDAVRRALAAGAKPPLEYVGAGMVGLVLKDQKNRAFKVARHVSPLHFELLEREYEWLRDAHRIDPERTVKPIRFDPENLVLIKEYVEGRPYGWAPGSVHQHFSELAKRMEKLDWGAPEFKDDSYIQTEDGFVLVDAGMAQRLCQRFVRWLREVLNGKRHSWSVGTHPEDLAFLLRREVIEGCVDEKTAEKLYPLIEQWVSKKARQKP